MLLTGWQLEGSSVEMRWRLKTRRESHLEYVQGKGAGDERDGNGLKSCLGLTWGLSGKEFTCQYRRCGFDPWVRKIPWRKKWQPTPVFLQGNSMGREAGQATVHGVAKELDMT